MNDEIKKMSVLKDVAPGEDLRFKYEVVLRDLNTQRDSLLQYDASSCKNTKANLLKQKRTIKNWFETLDQINTAISDLTRRVILIKIAPS